jgi:hypothetical protein
MSDQDLPLRPAPAPGSTPEPAPPEPPSSRRGLTVALIIGAVVLAVGVWAVITLLPGLLNAPPASTTSTSTENTPAAPSDARKVHVSLFYVSDSGLELVPVGRDIPYGATPSEQARKIVEEQVKTPPEGYASAIPAETTVRAVYLGQKGDAYVDLGPEIVAHHSGGTIDEALTVYAIVNALSTNMNDVRTVQILIDGKEVDTLAGHIDLRRPLAKSPGWVQKASTPR